MPTININIIIDGTDKIANLSATDTDISENVSKIVSTKRLANLHPLIDHLYTFKPVNNNSENTFDTIIINVNTDATYSPKDGSQDWTILYSNIKDYLVQNLIDEILFIP